jgi:hypothetical protein
MNFGSDKYVITSASYNQFGPVVISPRQVVAGGVGRNEKVLSVIIPPSMRFNFVDLI